MFNIFKRRITRPEQIGKYILKTNSSIREAAKQFNISKSTAHTDVSEKLKYINPKLYNKVKNIMNSHKTKNNKSITTFLSGDNNV